MTLCAAMGIYNEPQSAAAEAWKDRCLDDLDAILQAIQEVQPWIGHNSPRSSCTCTSTAP